MSNPARPPIIIIGMHRSGTSMLCRLLESLGLFVGAVKQWNNESPFFQIINEWLLRRCGATYKTPGVFLKTLGDARERDSRVRAMRYLLNSPFAGLYLGPLKYLRYRTPARLQSPWGWKDPRSTVTLPLWLDLFPGARIVHIIRHGVDVANSLRTRRRRNLNRLIAVCEEIQLKSWRQPDRGASLHTRRLLTLMGGFSLWEEYLVEARRHVQSLGDRAVELKYEDFLDAPHAQLKSLARFCGLEPTDADVARITRRIRMSRSRAYRNVPELQEFTDQVADRLRAHGY